MLEGFFFFFEPILFVPLVLTEFSPGHDWSNYEGLLKGSGLDRSCGQSCQVFKMDSYHAENM